MAAVMSDPAKRAFVPVTIRSRSRVVSLLWRWLPVSWLGYERARRLARWLP